MCCLEALLGILRKMLLERGVLYGVNQAKREKKRQKIKHTLSSAATSNTALPVFVYGCLSYARVSH